MEQQQSKLTPVPGGKPVRKEESRRGPFFWTVITIVAIGLILMVAAGVYGRWSERTQGSVQAEGSSSQDDDSVPEPANIVYVDPDNEPTSTPYYGNEDDKHANFNTNMRRCELLSIEQHIFLKYRPRSKRAGESNSFEQAVDTFAAMCNDPKYYGMEDLRTIYKLRIYRYHAETTKLDGHDLQTEKKVSSLAKKLKVKYVRPKYWREE